MIDDLVYNLTNISISSDEIIKTKYNLQYLVHCFMIDSLKTYKSKFKTKNYFSKNKLTNLLKESNQNIDHYIIELLVDFYIKNS